MIIGSRDSALALWQAGWVIHQLENQDSSLELIIKKIKTQGDKILDVPLARVGGKGLFVKEIESALLAGEIDLAVHSLKDLPTDLPDGLVLIAVSEREDARDVLVSRRGLTLEELPSGSRVGTSSLRRSAQLLHYRPDLEMVNLRGNLDTRLRKAATEAYDAVVVAAAGVLRLGLESQITQYIPLEICLPAVGQGVLGIEIRADDACAQRLLTPINDLGTYQAALAERAFLRTLEGGCQVPIGAYAEVVEGRLRLTGMVASLDGRKIIREDKTGSAAEAEHVGESLAQELLERGAGRLLSDQRALQGTLN